LNDVCHGCFFVSEKWLSRVLSDQRPVNQYPSRTKGPVVLDPVTVAPVGESVVTSEVAGPDVVITTGVVTNAVGKV
jgi:hypothetical protein